ncbi:YqaJ viral recombinase family protein [Streptomyces cinereoruber]|uniref:YqaJ viral recombinase family nuclease n=1 Tax=Streptomyces cinereoruber TaxID=67260 RepID=UPI003C2E8B0B
MTVLTPALFDLPGEDAVILRDAPAARLLLPANASRWEWEAARRLGLGGSDIAAILGLGGGKYSSPRHVFEAKHGRAEKVTSEAAEIGTEIEGFIARMFTKRSGIRVMMPPGTLANVERPWMLANVDRYALDSFGHVVGPLECKNRSAYQLSDWENGQVPDAPAIQCLWYMAVGGWDHGYVAALVGGNTLRWQRIERDEEIIADLIDFCGVWFERHVVEGFPPPADGYEATTKLLSKLWSVKAETVAQVDLARAKELRARRADLKDQEKDLAHQLRTVENEMRLIAADAPVVEANGKVAWTWKPGNFAPKQFADAEPELAAKYTRMAPVLDLDRLKAERPEIYEKYRGRTLNVPKKEI